MEQKTRLRNLADKKHIKTSGLKGGPREKKAIAIPNCYAMRKLAIGTPAVVVTGIAACLSAPAATPVVLIGSGFSLIKWFKPISTLAYVYLPLDYRPQNCELKLITPVLFATILDF